MGLQYENGEVIFSPGVVDVHTHPRVFDPLTDHSFDNRNRMEGKAGLPEYSAVALRSGIVAMIAMPNEFYRRVLPESEGTEIVQYPISNADRVAAFETSIATQTRVRTAYNLGLDRAEILQDEGRKVNVDRLRANFMFAGVNAAGLKIFFDESTGGQQIPVERAAEIIAEWHDIYPDKPIICHAEDGNVRTIIESVKKLPDGFNIPLHIAHVSSQEELEARIGAAQDGMNVTCEATSHHMFTTDEDGAEIGGYGCVKPSLKTAKDMAFLWDNLEYIDMFASDCAPHRLSDKEAENPAYGVTNHTVMLPLFLGAVEEGRLTLEQLYDRLVVNPRRRFNLPMDDGTETVIDTRVDPLDTKAYEAVAETRYGQNIFAKLEEVGKSFHLLGQVVQANSGISSYGTAKIGDEPLTREYLRTDLRHLVRVS